MSKTFMYLIRLLGLTKDAKEQIEIEQKFCLAKILFDESTGKPYSKFDGTSLTNEQMMGYFLKNQYNALES